MERGKDEITSPAHYTYGNIEPWDAIIDWQLSYCLGNVVKYVVRHKHKGNPLRDLKKARQYLDKEIASMEAAAREQHVSPPVVDEGEDG